MTEEERKELYRKCVAKLDELENNGLDLGDWSIEDAYTEGAVFGYKIAEEEIEDWKACHEHQLELMKGLNDRIADLEKKVKYYEQQLSAMEKGVCDVCKVKDADYYEKQIADLIETCKDKDRQLDNWYKEWQKQDRQLEQAKQIIKDILLDSEKWDYKDLMFKPLREQAEQFINDNKIICEKNTGKFFGTVS